MIDQFGDPFRRKKTETPVPAYSPHTEWTDAGGGKNVYG